jgi:dTDP-4-dehydrorhamnose reductase
MNILITGASSYIGSGLYENLKKKFDVTGTYNSNKFFDELKHLDITNKKQVAEFVHSSKPEVIIHTAGNASAPSCEKNPDLAKTVNQDGTENIVEAANAVHAKVIFISSYAVDDGGTVYGRTKIAAEDAVRKTSAGYVILRPCLTVGVSPNIHNDRPFNRILKNIVEEKSAGYDATWKFQPTWLKHLEEVIAAVIEKNIINESFPVAVPEMTTRYDFAKDLAEGSDIEIIPERKPSPIPDFYADLSKLGSLGLPEYTYNEMIAGIREEIKKLKKK